MPSVDPDLVEEAEGFAGEIADLLDRTVANDPPIRALTRDNRVVVAPFTDSGDKTDLPLRVAGEHRLDLRVEYLCTWDFAGHYLAIEKSEFALKVPHLREALVRFDYLRSHSWAPAHVQLHAESSALGWLHAFTGTTKPPRVQQLANWRRVQVKALIRDVIKDDPAAAAAELHATIDEAVRDVREHPPQ